MVHTSASLGLLGSEYKRLFAKEKKLTGDRSGDGHTFRRSCLYVAQRISETLNTISLINPRLF